MNSILEPRFPRQTVKRRGGTLAATRGIGLALLHGLGYIVGFLGMLLIYAIVAGIFLGVIAGVAFLIIKGFGII